MKFTKLVSSVILVSSLATILLFALILWLYSNADTKTLALLKEALSTTSSFFGGITTLVAAYIASSLYTDWKAQTKYAEQLKNISNIAVKFKKIPSIIETIRSDKSNADFLSDRYNYVTGKKKHIDESLEFKIPSFDVITNLIDELEEALILVKVYSFSTDNNELDSRILDFKHSLKVWMSGFHKLKNDFNTSKISNLDFTNIIDYVYLFCDSNSEFYKVNFTDLGVNYSIYNHNEIDIFHDQIAVSIAIGEFLEKLEKL